MIRKPFKQLSPARLLLRAFVVFWIWASAFLVIQFVVWQIRPYSTATIKEPIIITNENNVVTDKIGMVLEINKKTDVTPVVSRNIICEEEVFQVGANTVGVARPQGEYSAVVIFDVPKIPVGSICIFEFINDYQVNPVRVITKIWRSEPFTIGE